MATSTSGNLHPGSRRVGMMLRNLSAWEVRIPPNRVISYVQAAKIVTNVKVPKCTGKVLPSMEQTEPSCIGQPTCFSPQNEWTHLTLISPQLELDDPTSECDMLDKVDLSGCTKWDPKDQQETRNNLREYADVFAKDNLNLGQISIVKHKITLEEGVKLIKEQYRRVPPGL